MRSLAALVVVCLALVVPASASCKDRDKGKAATTHAINDSGVTVTIECTKDKPAVALNGSGNTVTVQGACSKVAVNGAGNKVTIASVELLAVNGADNTVHADAAGKIAATGSDNTITYKGGLPGTKEPKVGNLGTGNTIKKKE